MPSILLICTANLCRSPMAEGVLRKMLRDRDCDLEVDSAGTHDYHVGKQPFPIAVEVAESRGYDIRQCVARRIRPDDFDHFDMILAMDRANIASMRAVAPTRSKPKIELLTEYSDQFYGKDVPDPYGGNAKDFELALAMIEDACRGLVDLLVKTSRTAAK